MGEPGKVVETHGGSVTVALSRSDACGECRACLSSGKDMLITAHNLCGAKTGDWVRVELNEASFLSAVLIMYGLPFISMILGILSGYYIFIFMKLEGFKEPAAAVSGIFFMMLSYVYIKKKNWKIERYRPEASEIISGPVTRR